jgi:hypothetical protein
MVMKQASKHKHAPVTHGRPDSGDAFLPDPGDGPARIKDDLAEEMAEEFLAGATGSEETLGDDGEGEVSEEMGGPFVYTSAREEFAKGIDKSNPRSAEKEAFPLANAHPDDAEE